MRKICLVVLLTRTKVARGIGCVVASEVCSVGQKKNKTCLQDFPIGLEEFKKVGIDGQKCKIVNKQPSCLQDSFLCLILGPFL